MNKKIKNKKYGKNEHSVKRGSILAYALVMISMLLAIAAAMSAVTTIEKKNAGATTASVQAYQVADSGIQQAFKKIHAGIKSNKLNTIKDAFSGCDTGNIATNTDGGPAGSNYQLSFYSDMEGAVPIIDCDITTLKKIKSVKAVGIYKNTARAIQATVPADPCDDEITLEDIRGTESNTYDIVKIGNQCWMAENLRATIYPDGTAVEKGPSANKDPAWDNPAKAFYSCPSDLANDEDCAAASGSDKLGMLYNWFAAMYIADFADGVEGAQGICPAGWHLPTDGEFKTLEKYLGMSQADADLLGYRGDGIGKKMQELAAFNIIFAGNRYTNDKGLTPGEYANRGNYVDFWGSSPNGSMQAWERCLPRESTTEYSKIGRFNDDVTYGFSVRCIKG